MICRRAAIPPLLEAHNAQTKFSGICDYLAAFCSSHRAPPYRSCRAKGRMQGMFCLPPLYPHITDCMRYLLSIISLFGLADLAVQVSVASYYST